MMSDHAVFKRLSRQQLIVRRRSIGFQVLAYTPTTAPLRCKHCGRFFNAIWKEYLCHVCGFWVCQPCSNVIEREREMYVIRYVRACARCMSIVNKWSDPELITEFAIAPWVVASSKRELSLHLADTLRTTKDRRHAVVTLLKYLGRPVGSIDPEMLDEIEDDDWVTTNCTNEVHGILPIHVLDSSERDEAEVRKLLGKSEMAQFLVQQCFEVSIAELPVDECVFAESAGVRQYPIYYDEETESPAAAPTVAKEEERTQCIIHYDLTGRDVNTDDMALICDLAAKELDALTAFISIIQGDQHLSVACRPGSKVGACGVFQWRSQTFCAYALTSLDRPFLVRDAVLDFRFRNLPAVRGDANIQFYFGFPIVSHTGVPIASLCIVDTKPRKHVTTMQYSIVKRLAAMAAEIWKDKYGAVV